MSAKFKAGDKVLVNGTLMELGSWPEDNQGPFFARYTNNQGGEVQGTYWANMVDTEGEPVHTSATVDLVQAGDGVQSTLGDISGVAVDEPDAAEVAGEVAEAKAVVEETPAA